MNTDATRAHIDAETLAAWADRGLPADAAAEVELHLSNCDRCQQMLAAFVRSEPTTGAVIIPFWTRRPVQWSAAGLAAAAAIVAMIWIGRPPSVPTPQSTVAEARSESKTQPFPSPASLPSPSAAATVDQLQTKQSVSAAKSRQEGSSLRDKTAANETTAKKETGRAVGAATPALPPPVPMPAAVAAPPPPAAAAPAGVTVTGAAPVVTSATLPRPTAVSETVAMDAFAAKPAIPAILEIFAPEPNAPAFRADARAAGRGGGGGRGLSQGPGRTRWRIVAGTHVDHSSDAGSTWTALTIEPALTTPLVAGVATSQSNCWLAGRDGVVLVTNDGRTFRRVPVPEVVDLTAVIAEDGLHATVTAIDGRKFSTVDGGLTWK